MEASYKAVGTTTQETTWPSVDNRAAELLATILAVSVNHSIRHLLSREQLLIVSMVLNRPSWVRQAGFRHDEGHAIIDQMDMEMLLRMNEMVWED